MARFPGDFLQKVRDNTNILDVGGVLCIVKEEMENVTGRAARFTGKTPSFSVFWMMDLYYCSACHAAVMFFPSVETDGKTSALRSVRRLAKRRIGAGPAEVSPEENNGVYSSMMYDIPCYGTGCRIFPYCLSRSNMGTGLAYFKRRQLTDENHRQVQAWICSGFVA